MSGLGELVGAVDPELARHAVAEPEPAQFRDVPDPTRAFVLEAVYEGYLMHYGRPRAFAKLDPDLRLLGGDALYALGLERLADAGDAEAIGELSDLISLCAWAHATERPELAEKAWAATARRLSGEASAGAREAVAGRLASGR